MGPLDLHKEAGGLRCVAVEGPPECAPRGPLRGNVRVDRGVVFLETLPRLAVRVPHVPGLIGGPGAPVLIKGGDREPLAVVQGEPGQGQSGNLRGGDRGLRAHALDGRGDGEGVVHLHEGALQLVPLIIKTSFLGLADQVPEYALVDAPFVLLFFRE